MMMDGLVQSEKSYEHLKMLADTLVDRQVKGGERQGSFSAKAHNSFYYDYTPPLALIAAAQDPKTMDMDQEIYLDSVKSWLKHSYENQDEMGVVKPYGIGDANVASTEAAAGVAWVAAWYKKAIDKNEHKAELSAISKNDPHALDTLIDRSLTALESAQSSRTDGLIDSAEEWPFAYYTANAHIHAALVSTMDAYPEDSEPHKRAKTVDDKLVKGMKEFLVVADKQGHIPFQKGHASDNFVQSEGHEVIVDAYAGILHGRNKMTDALKTHFEKTMGNPKDKDKFMEIQTVPASVPMALQATGHSFITINGKDTPITEVMEEQLAALQGQAHKDYVHKISIAALAGYKGSAWLPSFEAPIRPKAELVKDKPAPAADTKTDDAFSKALDAFAKSASKDTPLPVAPPGIDARFNQALDEFVKRAAKDAAPVELPEDPFAPSGNTVPKTPVKTKQR